ncbi:ectonucleotide pyrophosphatase/phosphodiesterase family member 5-like isoform X2 [Thrips palmi]|nr:ectonucleotide pyrophosphatase/phosphodiesterase family member 5-like isoform X2 [Thrips palmi]
MIVNYVFLVWTSFFTFFYGAHLTVEAVSKYPKLLIISMDAFRPGYVDDCLTPTIVKLRSSGVYAPYIRNVFPTKTFPNHHSIATGVFPEVHGVLDSTVYTSKDSCCSNRTLIGYSYELYHYNNDILPIWTLNQLAGKGRHSGVMMWPGGEFPYGCKKTTPTFSQKWNLNTSYQDRVDAVMSWFTHKETPANLVMLYFEEPDFHGHAFGIDSLEVRDQVKRLDRSLDYIFQQLKKHGLDELVTVFALSDHGMVNLNQNNIIDLNRYVDNSTYVMAGYSPVLQIFPSEGKEWDVLSGLKKAHSDHKNKFNVYTREDIPSEWHYAANNRTPPILVVANEGFAFQDFYKNIDAENKRFDIEPNPRNKYGIHGYSNSVLSMFPVFFAWGPLVKSGMVLDPFNNTQLYPLWAYILNLELEHEVYSRPNFSMLRSSTSSVGKFNPAITKPNVVLQVPFNTTRGQLNAGAPIWTYW